MRALAFSLITLLSIVDLTSLQAAEPRVRPALIGNGPKALINMIDTKKLIEKGQPEGLLMFKAWVGRSGKVWVYNTYRETPGSKLLKEEVGNSILASSFIPAIYNGERTDVGLVGTVVFRVADSKPHLRIYLNQNYDDIAKGNDFIAPQLVTSSADFTGSHYDLAGYKAAIYGQNGWIQMSVTVDANGNQKDLKVTLEDPPGFGFATVARHAYAKAKWIPGFRNGHPVECSFDYPDWFRTWRQPHG
jgi:hypothetical protein